MARPFTLTHVRDTLNFRIFETPTVAGKKFEIYWPKQYNRHMDMSVTTYMGTKFDPDTYVIPPKPRRDPCPTKNCGCKGPKPRKPPVRRKAKPTTKRKSR